MSVVKPIDAYVLDGGLSTRMGTEKALLELDGRAFVERIAAAARTVARSVTVVGRELPIGGLRYLSDLRPGLGPMAGIETALTDSTTGHALVVACDLPFVNSSFLKFLLERSAARPDAAIVPVAPDGHVSPLCAVYPGSALPIVSDLIDRGERKPRALLMRIPTELVRFEDYAQLESASDLLRNVNTPEDLAEALRIGPTSGEAVG